MKRLTVFAVVAVLGAGCSDRGIMDVSPQLSDPPNAALSTKVGDLGLTVMSWNVYYGTDPKPILSATNLDEFLAATTQAWELAQATNFPERAGTLAKLIAANQPDLVGVQEAALYRMDPSDFLGDPTNNVPPNPIPNAQTVVYDFLQLLTDALDARGMHYVVAVADSSSDWEVPVITASGLMDLRLTDRDAILVRADLVHRIVATAHGRYDNFFPLNIGGYETGLYEGWSSADVKVRGQTYRFVSTHMEIRDFGTELQKDQANELLDTLSHRAAIPTIVVGDFNSDANSTVASEREVYELMTGTGPEQGGFTDSWLRPLFTPPGLTCCQDDDLLNPISKFDQRVDFVFTRDMPQERQASTIVLGRNVVGDEETDRTLSGLWPSDHGAVVATFVTSSFGPFGPLASTTAK